MKFIFKFMNWFRFKFCCSEEQDWQQIQIHQQALKDLERIKTEALYQSRGL